MTTMRIGIGERGAAGLRVRRPHGSGDHVVVVFCGPAWIGPGEPRAVTAGDAIVWGPTTPTLIWSDTVIDNHYAHLPSSLVEPALTRFPLPLDEILRPDTTTFVPDLLARLQREHATHDVHADRAVELIIEDLVLQLHRHTVGRRRRRSPHDQRLRDLRLQVLRDPAAAWTVERLAGSAHLRPSRLTAVWRELFGRSPMADVIEIRLETARFLLVHHEISIAAAGARAGFGDPAAFSRRFRARHAASPGEYRRAHR